MGWVCAMGGLGRCYVKMPRKRRNVFIILGVGSGAVIGTLLLLLFLYYLGLRIQ